MKKTDDPAKLGKALERMTKERDTEKAARGSAVDYWTGVWENARKLNISLEAQLAEAQAQKADVGRSRDNVIAEYRGEWGGAVEMRDYWRIRALDAEARLARIKTNE